MRLQAFLLLVSFQWSNSLHVAVSDAVESADVAVLDAVESADVSACPNMTILTGTSGIITSPSYPGKYGNYHRCSWKIMASTGYRVKLVIQDMEIEGGTNCPYDYIQIQNAVIYGSGVLPGRLCGSLTSNSTFSSYDETLIVRFVTDGSVTARGFKARYTVIPGCALNYKKVGCFKDDRKNPRPVPVLVFTDRDVSSDVWSGKTIGWPNWDTYIVDLVCRCANESRARNYSHFSIQYYGECWSGSDAAKTYDRAGPSESCLTKGVMQKCNVSDDVECVGEANTNFVYEIKEKAIGLRLIGGRGSGEGRVEIYYRGSWGTVCDYRWDIDDARVVCRQLGYPHAISAPNKAFFGQGSGKIWLHVVQCQGDESSIVNCPHSPWGVHGCGHHEDASVICSSLRLIGGSWPGEGRVEIYYRGSWGTVCDDDWDINDARVVCRQLGYSSAVSAPQSARFGQGSGRIWLDDVQCQGYESSIGNCRHRPWGVHDCSHREDASVICSKPTLRLIGGSGPREGRVEIYYRGSWGTVCDDGWDINDARVVCRQLGYSSAVSAPQSARFGQGSGKIWLDDVQCQGNETSIVNCRRRPWGVHNCGHHEDASVICSGA